MGSSVPGEIRPVLELDVTSTRCPETWNRVLAAMGAVGPGEAVHVVLSAGEQMEQVPAALKSEGHRVVSVLREGKRYHLLVRRDGASVAANVSGKGKNAVISSERSESRNLAVRLAERQRPRRDPSTSLGVTARKALPEITGALAAADVRACCAGGVCGGPAPKKKRGAGKRKSKGA